MCDTCVPLCGCVYLVHGLTVLVVYPYLVWLDCGYYLLIWWLSCGSVWSVLFLLCPINRLNICDSAGYSLFFIINITNQKINQKLTLVIFLSTTWSFINLQSASISSSSNY